MIALSQTSLNAATNAINFARSKLTNNRTQFGRVQTQSGNFGPGFVTSNRLCLSTSVHLSYGIVSASFIHLRSTYSHNGVSTNAPVRTCRRTCRCSWTAAAWRGCSAGCSCPSAGEATRSSDCTASDSAAPPVHL